MPSAIAFAEGGHRWFSWHPGKREEHITALNMWGSVLIGISAVGEYVDPDGQMVSALWANGGTFLGAVCFLVASILKLPEGRKPRLSSPHDWDLQAVSRARRSHPHPGPRRPRSALRASHV